ncbi:MULTISPECIES: hypothetical protein [Bacillus cereus group]|uniref:hypothetical protein n=1 Tax=Bacillus cereus group TaxID=86661 RepID=UPI0022E434A6|nr:hypothetical protein [Bacillus cereus group sp. TH152-1LC]MDA1674512.1 hypothetical protein [Bacillus cereus group sp. TH152-1LC]
MIQPIYIESILKQNQFNVQYLDGVDTGAISIHSFSVQAEGTDTEVVTVKYAKVCGNKLFINTDNGVNVLGESLTRKLEETIQLAVAMTPENRLPNLLNPIFFASDNFHDLMEYEVDEETLEEDFSLAVKPIYEKSRKEDFSFYALSLPINKYSEYIRALFEKLSSVHSILHKNNKMFVKFHSFHEQASQEFKLIHDVRNALCSIGVVTEVADIMEF